MICSTRRARGLLVAGVLVLAGCGADETISFTNDGATAVTVDFAGGSMGEIAPYGGAALPTDDCLQGPIVVTYESGRVVALAESACPGQRLQIGDDTAELVAEPPLQ